MFSKPAMFIATSTLTRRALSTLVPPVTSSLRKRMEELVPGMQKNFNGFKKIYANKKLGEYTVDQTVGGARGIKALITETSLLDEVEGIRFRGLTIPEIKQKLPAFKTNGEPMPEGIFWLLLTGEIPTKDQVCSLTEDLHKRSTLPSYVLAAIDSFPEHMHPVTQQSAAILLLQSESRFAKAYAQGCSKKDFWRYYLEDSLDLIARQPQVCAAIYHKVKKTSQIAPDNGLDWTGNFVKMLGFGDKEEFAELLRLHLCIHSDHEGGNVSAHTTHLVGSALSDAYLSLSSGLCGLAGPLHGLAAQEVLVWIDELRNKLGTDSITKEAVEQHCTQTLKSGNVIPGFGHAVLRRTDPRYLCFRDFALKHFPDDPNFQIVDKLFHVVPPLLGKLGKIKNPWPNIDAHSGICLTHYGFNEPAFFTVLFGLSRTLGVLASLVLDRVYNLPIERPKSVTTEWIKKNVKN